MSNPNGLLTPPSRIGHFHAKRESADAPPPRAARREEFFLSLVRAQQAAAVAVDGDRSAGGKADTGLGAGPEGGLLEHRADAEGDGQSRRHEGAGDDDVAHRPYSSVSGTIDVSLPLGQFSLST
jgi:hypothetical protein